MVFNALIPARSGSKRVPGKNIRDFCGKPLMVWSIEQAIESGCFQDVYVSSDSEEYFDIARKAGAKVIDRGNMEENEEQPMNVVLAHAYPIMEPSHATVILQPTSPLRSILDIERTIEEYVKGDAAYMVSVFPEIDHLNIWDIEQHVNQWRIPTGISASLEKNLYKHKHIENGAIYITNRSNVVRGVCGDGHVLSFYEMPKSRSFEIDTEEDWKICEIMMRERLRCSNEKK